MTASPTIVIYDGWCSVCSASAGKLRRLDGGRGVLLTVDLRQDSELITKHGLSPSEVRRVMHAIAGEGQVFVGMDALRVALSAVGRGWMIRWTRLWLFRAITDRLYLWFADNRHRWFAKGGCADGACSIRSDRDTTHTDSNL